MEIDLYLTQEALELESRANTITRFTAQHMEKVERGEESGTYYGAALLKRAIEPMVQLIRKTIAEAQSGKVGPKLGAVRFLEKFTGATLKDDKLDVVAYCTARNIIDRLTTKMSVQNISIQIAQALEDELRYASFEEQHPALFKLIQNETSTTRERKRTTIVGAYNRYADAWPVWDMVDKLHLGMKLVEIFIEATGFIQIVTRKAQKNKTEKFIVATDVVVDFINANKDAAEMLQPMYMPMVVPPIPWEGPRGGGYLTHHCKPLAFIKTPNKNYLEELEGMPEQMAPVYAAINKIQATPWAINPFVLVVFQMVLERGLAVGGLPLATDIPIPPAPLEVDCDKTLLTDDEKRKFKAWKRSAAKIYTDNIRLVSKRIMVNRIQMLAEKFVHYDAIYFPLTCDFRGRSYSVPSYLNPQGNSLGKGMLKFADGKALGTNEAACELAIHGANCYGFDKAGMQERVDWVVERSDRICQVATNPMDDLWWAKEADDCWSFLAFCEEWKGYCDNGYDHVSYIPIAKDGSCSGLQHWSAALLDISGAKATNVLPSDKPADIYQTVLDKAMEMVVLDLKDPELASLAQGWIDYKPSRACSKRSTMTKVYGSTIYSAREFIQEYLGETDNKRLLMDKNYVSPMDGVEFEASVYLAKHIWDAINDTVVAAKEGMAWLQACSRIMAEENLPIHWTTVDGLPVMQNYPDIKKRRVKTKFGDTLVYLTVHEHIKNKLDRRRQGNGVSPNWTHANDGCHLRMTVNLASSQPEGAVTHFAMIHDSFGCHASDVEMLGACLRETFIDLYQNHDPLQMFKDQCEALIGKPMPDLPPKGSLDLTEVKHSEFFFS